MGPQLALMTNAKLTYQHEYGDIELNTSVKNTDAFRRLDAGLVAGVGYKLRKGTGMNIGLKYYEGFVDVSKTSSLHNTNRVFYLKVDIPIGREKAKENAAKKADAGSTTN